ncbi:hypothetical protein V8C35DRAFT_291219 [Trichoderma chlorosporum]
MSKRPSTETLTEASNTVRASKRVKLDNSPPAKHHLRDEAPALGSSASVAPTRNRKRAASEGPVEAPGGCSPFPSTSKRQRLDDDSRQHNLDRGTVSAAAAAGNPPTWDRQCEAIGRAMEKAMRLSEQDEAINDALFGYEIVDTTEEGLCSYRTADRVFEQLNFKKLQFDAIRLLIHPERRQHPEIGLRGSVRTPVRYWAKRLEANRLIRLGLPPWHLENWGEVCGFRVPGRYIRPPRGHPPVIPLEYCETHISTLAEFLKGRENQRTQSDIVQQLLRDIKWLKAMTAVRNEYLGVEGKPKAAKSTEGGSPQAADTLPKAVQPALEQAGEHEDNQVEGSSPETTIMPSSPCQPPTPEPINQQQQQQQKKNEKTKKTRKTRKTRKTGKTTPSHHMTRRSARRAPVDETWELDSRGRRRIAKRG